jgi:hypothetical protein
MLYPKKSPAKLLQEKNEKKKLAEKQREVLSHLISSSVLDTNSVFSNLTIKNSSAVIQNNATQRANTTGGPAVNLNNPQSLAVSQVFSENQPQQGQGKHPEQPSDNMIAHQQQENNNGHGSETLSELEKYLEFLEQQEVAPDREFAFLEEKDEWLGLQKYLSYLKDKQDSDKKKRKNDDLVKLREAIAEQIVTKKTIKNEKVKEDLRYLNFLKAQS